MFKIDVTDFKDFENALGTFRHRALPHAHKRMLNDTAQEAQKIARKRVRNSMVLRNAWTIKTIQFRPTKTLNIQRQASTVGSTEEYMLDQEVGGVKVKSGKHGVPIPTSFSAGQAEKSRPRLKLPRTRLPRLRLGRRRKRPTGQPKGRKQAILFKIQDAVSSGRRVFFHDFGTSRGIGIFRVKGGRKGFKRGGPKGAELKMLFSFAKPAVSVPRRPWLKPAVEVARKRMPSFYVKALRFQLRRHGIFK